MRTTARHGGKALTVATLALACILLAGCATTVDDGAPDPGLRGQWELLSATDAAGEIPIANQRFSLTIDRDSSTNGRSACADYKARVLGTLGQLWITATLPKDEHCAIQAQQDIEQRYITDLNLVRTSTVDGGILDLRAPGIDLKFQRALNVPLDLVVDQTWHLATVSPDNYYLNNEAAPIDQTGASIRISHKGTLTGTTGCRTFTARWVENADEIVVSDYRATSSHGPCDAAARTTDGYVVSVVRGNFTFLSGKGELAIASPRAEIALGFIN